jgi:hypothetical protein
MVETETWQWSCDMSVSGIKWSSVRGIKWRWGGSNGVCGIRVIRSRVKISHGR